jgi:hypothetical protein
MLHSARRCHLQSFPRPWAAGNRCRRRPINGFSSGQRATVLRARSESFILGTSAPDTGQLLFAISCSGLDIPSDKSASQAPIRHMAVKRANRRFATVAHVPTEFRSQYSLPDFSRSDNDGPNVQCTGTVRRNRIRTTPPRAVLRCGGFPDR